MNAQIQRHTTSEYHIYQSKLPFFWTSIQYGCPNVPMSVIEHAFRKGKYKHVHTLTLPSDDLEFQLEECFRLTNNIDESWNKVKPNQTGLAVGESSRRFRATRRT